MKRILLKVVCEKIFHGVVTQTEPGRNAPAHIPIARIERPKSGTTE